MNDDPDELIGAAWRAEEALLTADVRHDIGRLGEFLAPDFYEIGQSGRRWDRAAMMAALVDDTAALPEAALAEREATLVASDVVLLSYAVEVGSRSSRRSSIWRRAGDSVQCLFHQGTPIPR